MNHGTHRVRTIRAGNNEFRRRERYCAVHGWIDLFITNDSEWDARHAGCGQPPKRGATIAAAAGGRLQ